MTTPNKAHYHIWLVSRSNPFMRYAWRRGFHTRQAARKYALARLEKDGFEIKECWRPECAPKLN